MGLLMWIWIVSVRADTHCQKLINAQLAKMNFGSWDKPALAVNKASTPDPQIDPRAAKAQALRAYKHAQRSFLREAKQAAQKNGRRWDSADVERAQKSFDAGPGAPLLKRLNSVSDSRDTLATEFAIAKLAPKSKVEFKKDLERFTVYRDSDNRTIALGREIQRNQELRVNRDLLVISPSDCKITKVLAEEGGRAIQVTAPACIRFATHKERGATSLKLFLNRKKVATYYQDGEGKPVLEDELQNQDIEQAEKLCQTHHADMASEDTKKADGADPEAPAKADR